MTAVFEIRGNNHCGGGIFLALPALINAEKLLLHSDYFLLFQSHDSNIASLNN